MKPKDEIKPIEGTPNNQSKAKIIFNELINKRKELMNKLDDSVDYNNLKFEYMTKAKDVSFYEYKDPKELSNVIRDGKIGFSDAKNKQDDFLSKLTNIKTVKKTLEQKEVINNIERFYISRQEVFIFLEAILKCYLMQITVLNKMRLKEKDLKY